MSRAYRQWVFLESDPRRDFASTCVCWYLYASVRTHRPSRRVNGRVGNKILRLTVRRWVVVQNLVLNCLNLYWMGARPSCRPCPVPCGRAQLLWLVRQA